MTEPTHEIARPPTSAFEERLRSWMDASDRRFEVRQAAPDTLELVMLDIIGEDWWTGGGITSKKVQEKLSGMPKAKTVKVLLNSPGGDAFEGLAIQALLRRHGGRVEIEVVGLAASAASIIAMAGDTIAMHEGSLMMVHEPWTFAIGNASEMRTAAEFLDKVNASGLDVYTRRTGRARDEVAALVAAETWMTAHEAVQQNFATSVIEGAEPERATAPKARAAAQAFMSARVSRPAPKPAPVQLSLPTTDPAPAPPAATNPPPEQPENRNMSDPKITDATPVVARALGLPAGSTEADIVAACSRLRELELQALTITGMTSSGEAVGAVRALKVKADERDRLAEENVALKAARDQQAFETLVARGQTQPIKLSPAHAKLYQERFDKAKAEGRGAEVVADLEGYLKIASPIVAERRQSPSTSTDGASGTSLTWNGKTFADLKPAMRSKLKAENEELYALMRRDWEANGSPAAASA